MKTYLYYEEMKSKDKIFISIGEESVPVNKKQSNDSRIALFEKNNSEIPVIGFDSYGLYDLVHVKYESDKRRPTLPVIKPEFAKDVEANFGDTIIYHAHKHIEINYVVSGEMNYLVNGEFVTLHEKDFFILGSKIPHAWKTRTKDTIMRFINVDINFLALPSYYYNEGENSKLILNEEFYLKISKGQPIYDVIKPIFDNAVKEDREKQDYYQSILRSEVSKLIFIIARNYDKKKPQVKKSNNLETIDLALKYIEDNCSEKLTLNDVAKEVFLNKNYISNYFKNKLEINFSDYLTRVRMVKASQMLTNPDCKIIEIAHECGYASIANFNAVFKKTFFCTPSEYRKRLERNKQI